MRKFVLVFTLLILDVGMLLSQVTRTSLGKDFWIAFPPTEHSNSGLLGVFISSVADAQVVIEARDRNGATSSQTVTTPAGSVYEAAFSTAGYELRSASFPNGSIGDCEMPRQQSVHITSNVDVAVYAVVRDNNTSDAWMVLPTHSLGLDHRVLSYTSEYAPSLFGGGFYPSQFVVLATEDDTQVDIVLNTDGSRVGTGKTRSVTLQRGESYLLQAAVSASQPSNDLTGTRVRATKPIVVLGSHYRAQVPILTTTASRDVLVEQMQSIDVWGRQYVVPPLKPPTISNPSGSNDVCLIRILTSVDSTQITVDGIGTQIIPRAGGIWELPVSRGRVISASHPVLVGVLDRSANRIASVTNSGDPSLMIIPPVEQYLSSYQTINIEPRENGRPVYDQHQLTVFAPLSAGGLSVDGNPVAPLTQIGSSNYGYTHIDVSAGVHRSIAAPDPVADTSAEFGILIYGYGPAESYGYTGGMAFEKLYQPRVWLRVLDTTVSPGQQTFFTVVVDSISELTSLDAMAVRMLTAEVAYNATLWVPESSVLYAWTATGATSAKVQFQYSFDSLRVGDTIAIIPGSAVLGNAASDSVRLVDVGWFDTDGVPADVQYSVRDGLLRIQGLCDKNGLRLFDPTVDSTLPRVRYFDLMGREITTYTSGYALMVQTWPDGRVTSTRILR